MKELKQTKKKKKLYKIRSTHSCVVAIILPNSLDQRRNKFLLYISISKTHTPAGSL